MGTERVRERRFWKTELNRICSAHRLGAKWVARPGSPLEGSACAKQIKTHPRWYVYQTIPSYVSPPVVDDPAASPTLENLPLFERRREPASRPGSREGVGGGLGTGG